MVGMENATHIPHHRKYNNSMTTEQLNKLRELMLPLLGLVDTNDLLKDIIARDKTEKKEFWIVQMSPEYASNAGNQCLVYTSEHCAKYTYRALTGMGRKLYHVKEV